VWGGWMVGEPRDQAVLSPDSRCVGGRCVMVKRENLTPDPDRSPFLNPITCLTQLTVSTANMTP